MSYGTGKSRNKSAPEDRGGAPQSTTEATFPGSACSCRAKVLFVLLHTRHNLPGHDRGSRSVAGYKTASSAALLILYITLLLCLFI